MIAVDVELFLIAVARVAISVFYPGRLFESIFLFVYIRLNKEHLQMPSAKLDVILHLLMDTKL